MVNQLSSRLSPLLLFYGAVCTSAVLSAAPRKSFWERYLRP